MFFKKLFSFSSSKEVLLYENKLYKMYSTDYEGKKAVKFIMTHDIKQYENLKKIRHDNILHPLKINVKNKSIVTQYLLPFDLIFKESTQEFNKFVFLCLAKALLFLQKNCSLSHNNLVSTSLFFNEDCKIVLGGFEKSYKATSFDADNIQFSNILYKYTGINNSVEDFIKKDGFTDSFFFDNEIFFFGFDLQPIEAKRNFMCLAKSKLIELVDIYKIRIINFYKHDLEKDFEKEYKEEVLDFIFYLDLEDYGSVIGDLYKVLDSNVRLYLLKRADKYLDKVKSLDSVTKSLLLGIKCKNQVLRTETFNFLYAHHSKLSESSQIDILNTSHDFISDEKGIELVLKYLDTARPLLKQSEIVYKLLRNYLTTSKNKQLTIDMIQVYFCTFNKYKVSTELLPILCTNLTDESLQPKIFPLIDCILKDLKDHKELIVSREWSFDKVKGLFNRKEKVEPKKTPQSPRADAADDDWDNDW